MARSTDLRNSDFLTQQLDLLEVAERGLSRGSNVPDIVTFAEDPRFLGKRLYPRQKTLLRLFNLDTEHMTAYDVEVINHWAEGFYSGGFRCGVSPDVWQRVDYCKQNGYKHFREILNISGRRSGKGHLGAIQAAYENWRLLMLGDPQSHYGIEPGKELYLYVTATGLAQAKAYQYADFKRAIEYAPCFRPYILDIKNGYTILQTDADRMLIAELLQRGIAPDHAVGSLITLAVSANSSAARGGAAFGIIFDEMAHMITGTDGPRTSDAVYNALSPSLGQMGKDGLIYIPTSPFTMVGKAFSLYQDGLIVEDDEPAHPTMLVVQLPAWATYDDYDDPEATGGRVFATRFMAADDPIVERIAKRDPYTYKVEYLAQWAEVIDAYLSPQAVEMLFQPLELPNGEMRHFHRSEQGVMRWIYRGHADPAKSNDNFAVAIGHTEPVTDDEGDVYDHVFIDWMEVWDPADYEDHMVPWTEIEDALVQRILAFPNMTEFSYDQYGSFATVPQMKQRLAKSKSRTHVKEATFTQQANARRAELFRTALGMGWVHAYRDDFGPEGESLLEQELKFLQLRNGKVDHQKSGPVTTKDLADCVMVVVESLLGPQLDKLRARERLGNATLAVGAQGGYHSGTVEETAMSSARRALMANSRATASRGYGRMNKSQVRQQPRRGGGWR